MEDKYVVMENVHVLVGNKKYRAVISHVHPKKSGHVKGPPFVQIIIVVGALQSGSKMTAHGRVLQELEGYGLQQ